METGSKIVEFEFKQISEILKMKLIFLWILKKMLFDSIFPDVICLSKLIPVDW